jgi:MFS family permease
MGVASLHLYTGGAFFNDLAQAIGLTRTQFGLGVFLATIGMALANPLVGRLIDRYGPLRPALASFAALSLMYMALGALTRSVIAFLILQFLVGMLAAGSGPIALVRGVSAWFAAGRGLALGILMTGIGVSAALTPPLLARVIASSGWQAGFYTLAAIAAVGLVPVALFLRLPPSSAREKWRAVGSGRDFSESERHVFWLLMAALSIMAMGFAGMMSHFVPMLIDFGATPVQAGKLAGVIGVSLLVSRLIVGWLIDRFFAPYVAVAICFICMGAFIALLTGGASAAVIGAVGFGAGMGSEGDLVGYLVTRYFGLGRFGRIYGWQYAAFILSAGLSPFWIGVSFDLSGSYRLAFVIGSLLLLVAAAVFMRLPRYDLQHSPAALAGHQTDSRVPTLRGDAPVVDRERGV